MRLIFRRSSQILAGLVLLMLPCYGQTAPKTLMAVYILDVDTNIKGEFGAVAPELTEALQTAFTAKSDAFNILERTRLDELVKANRLESDLDSMLHGGAPSSQFVHLVHADGFIRSELVDGPDGVVLTVTLVNRNSEILWQGQEIESRARWLLHDVQTKDAEKLAGAAEERFRPTRSTTNRSNPSSNPVPRAAAEQQNSAKPALQTGGTAKGRGSFITADYRLSVSGFRKDGNHLTLSLTAESLSDKPFRFVTPTLSCYLLDENGSRWDQHEADSAGFTWSGVEIEPGTRVKSNFTFIAKDNDSGTSFTLICPEGSPQAGRQIILRDISGGIAQSANQRDISQPAPPAPQKSGTEPGSFQTADYRLSVSAFRKDGNRLRLLVTVDSLLSNTFRFSIRTNSCYLLDENGNRWDQESSDSEGFAWSGFEIEPGTRITSLFAFAAKGDDTGSVFTLICPEGSPQPGREIIARGISRTSLPPAPQPIYRAR